MFAEKQEKYESSTEHRHDRTLYLFVKNELPIFDEKYSYCLLSNK